MPVTDNQNKVEIPDTYQEFENLTGQGLSETAVLDLALLEKAQRSIQYLQHAGLIAADDHKTITTLNVLKRVNHAAFAFEPNAAVQTTQEAFKQALAAGDVTEGGAQSPVARLVDSYLAARVEHNNKMVKELDALPSNLSPEEFNRTRHRAVENARKYEAERKYYQGSPELLNEAVRAHPEALASGFMSLGKLAVETGLIKGDKTVVRDMVDDTLAAAATHQLMRMAEEVMTTSDADMKLNREFSERYALNIIAKADDTAASTTPIDRAQIAEEGTTPQLARIQALSSLLSAHLHDLTRHTVDPQNPSKSTPSPEVLAGNLEQVKSLVNEYRSAAMSLASQFLAEGPSAGDPRMHQLRENLNSMMDDNNILRYMKREEAELEASRLAERSASFLLQRNPGNAKVQANIATLLAQTKAAAGQSMADKYATEPAASHTERAERAAGAMALGK
ncbi:MAG: hypothetical protein AB7L92_03470 [Alphaproteobacteria bacterium]